MPTQGFASINVVELNGKEIVKEITDRTFIMLESKKFALQVR